MLRALYLIVIAYIGSWIVHPLMSAAAQPKPTCSHMQMNASNICLANAPVSLHIQL